MRNRSPVPALRHVLTALVALLAWTQVQAQDDDEAERMAAIDDMLAEHPLYQNAAPHILQGAKRAAERAEPDADAGPGVLQTGDAHAWPRLWRQDGLLVTGSLTGTVGLFAMRNSAFSPPPALATGPRNPQWAEAFLEPGLRVQYEPAGAWKVYGSVSYMETATRGTDYGNVGNTWHGDTELLYAGVRWQDAARQLALDVSYGQQDFAIGDNLVIASGATNGPQRGADYLGPRSAWANAALATLTAGGWRVEGFWLKPNEAPADATGTRLGGVNVECCAKEALQAGFTWLRVPRSNIATRDGLDAYSLRASVTPLALRGELTLQGEYVWERKRGVAASGWYAEATWHPSSLPWRPIATLRYASFSGDRPGTADWEGFDPLFYGGSTPNWYQGKVASTLLANTNLDAVAASLTLAPNARNIVQLVYLGFAAAQANSPLVVPPAGGPVPNGGGVPVQALGREIDVIYTYTFDKAANVNLFAGYVAPGAGYQQAYAEQGGTAQGWWMLGTQLNISY